MARRRLLPMPIEAMVDDPRRIALPIAAKGMLYELCLHYWVSECREFPKDADSLFVILKAHRPTFSKYLPEILAIFADIRPQLEQAWKRNQGSRELLRHLRARRTANDRRKALEHVETSTPAPAAVKHGWRRKERQAQRHDAAAPSAVDDGSTFKD